MKKLLFLLFPVFSYGQISINTGFFTVVSSTTNAIAFACQDRTYTAGRLYLFIAISTGTTNPGTIQNTTELTWTSVVSTGNSTRRIQIFRCMPTSTTAATEDVGLGTFGGGSNGYTTGVWEITGVVQTGTNGADAIVQTTTGGTTGTDPTLTLSALLNNRSAVAAIFSNSLNPFGGTEESGWSEVLDDGYTTPDAGAYLMTRVNTTDNTPTVTASSSDWIGVSLELRASGRRAVIIN